MLIVLDEFGANLNCEVGWFAARPLVTLLGTNQIGPDVHVSIYCSCGSHKCSICTGVWLSVDFCVAPLILSSPWLLRGVVPQPKLARGAVVINHASRLQLARGSSDL